MTKCWCFKFHNYQLGTKKSAECECCTSGHSPHIEDLSEIVHREPHIEDLSEIVHRELTKRTFPIRVYLLTLGLIWTVTAIYLIVTLVLRR